MHKLLAIISALLAISVPSAQPLQIKVLDNDNLQPIRGVYLYDSEGGIDSTNASGRVTLHELKEDASVLFKNRLYKSKELSYSALNKNKTVTLIPVEESAEVSEPATSWFGENKESIPGKVLVLHKNNTALYNPQTTSALLAASDEVYIQKTGQGDGSPMLRGFTANSLVLTLDGVRMNNALYRSDNLQNLISLDPNFLEGVDVIAGPGSTLYGSDALGGVFNFHFKEPVISPDGALEKSSTAMGRFAFANREKTGSVNFSISKKNLASITAVSFSDFGDLRMGNDTIPLVPVDTPGFYNDYNRKYYMQGNTLVENPDPAVQKKSGYRLFNVLEKLRMVVNDKIALHGSLYFSTTGRVPRYDKLIEPSGSGFELQYADWYYGPQRWLFSTVALDYTKPHPLFASAKVTLAYQNCKESSHSRLKLSNELKNDTASVNVISASVACNKPIGEKSVLSYGIESAFNSVSPSAGTENIVSGQTTPIGTQYPDGSNDYISGDFFGSLKTRWSPTVTSVAGARYSRFYLHSLINDPLYLLPGKETRISAGAPSGCLGVIIHPFDFWSMTLNGSTGFRAPGISDFRSTTGDIRVLNNDLQPEYVYSLEFGNNVELGKNISLDATTFASQAQNLLIEKNIAFNGYTVPSLFNQGSATIGGGNIGLALRFSSRFSLKNTITFTAGLSNDSMPLYTVPPLFGASHFLFKFPRIKGDLYVRYNGMKTRGQQATDMVVPYDQLFLYPLDKNYNPFSPSWFTLNLAATAILTKSLDLNAGVENILNKCYRPYANGIAAPGINLVFSVQGKL